MYITLDYARAELYSEISEKNLLLKVYKCTLRETVGMCIIEGVQMHTQSQRDSKHVYFDLFCPNNIYKLEVYGSIHDGAIKICFYLINSLNRTNLLRTYT